VQIDTIINFKIYEPTRNNVGLTLQVASQSLTNAGVLSIAS